MEIRPQRFPSLKARYRQLLCAGIFLASVGAYGQAVTEWSGSANNDWDNADNWNAGLPAATDSRASFTNGGTYDVTVSGTQVFDQLYVFRGTTANISLEDGASLTGTRAIVTGTTTGDGTGPAHLNVTGPSSGTATISWAGSQFGVAQASSGSTATFSGAGLQVLDNGSSTVVGRFGDNNVLTLSDGAQWTGTKLTVYGNTAGTGSDGLTNNRAIITGTGTQMTLSGGLDVASGTASGATSSTIITNNRVLVEDGGKLTVTGGEVRIGRSGNATQSYRRDNRIEVTGTGSVMEVTGTATTLIGFAGNNNFNNRLVVSDGGTFRTDTALTIYSGTSNNSNRLEIGNGGTFITSSVVNNDNGLIRIISGGDLLAEDMEGNAATAIVNINGVGILEASGHIGEGVTVNVGNGGAANFRFHSSGNTLALDGDLNLNDGSTATFNISNAGVIDSVVIGGNGSFTIGESASLVIASSAYAFSVGDIFQLFSGNLAGLSGSFGESFITIPTLSGDLEWDLSRFTAEYGYQLTVVPEPSLVALGLGGAALALVAFRRRKAAR